MSKVSLVFLSSVSENLLRCWCFLTDLLSVTLAKIFPAPGLDCRACFTAGFQHWLLPPALFICPSLGPLWGTACLLLNCLCSQHIHVSREMCFSVCFHNYRCTEGMHTRGRSEDEFGSTEVESISKSCSSYCCPLLLHNCLGRAVYYFYFCQEQQ